MENLVRILRSVDYIEENLKESLCLKEIAEKAFLSEFYFHRLFHLLIGDSPGEYIKKRRLYEAALVLKEQEAKVIDVALDYGYQSPEAFSRAFSKLFGFSPVEMKQNRSRLIRFPKPALTLTDLNHIHEGVTMEPEIIEREEMKFVGLVYYGDNQNCEIGEFWQRHFGKVADLPQKGRADVTESVSTRPIMCRRGCFITCPPWKWTILIQYLSKPWEKPSPSINTPFSPTKEVWRNWGKPTNISTGPGFLTKVTGSMRISISNITQQIAKAMISSESIFPSLRNNMV